MADAPPVWTDDHVQGMRPIGPDGWRGYSCFYGLEHEMRAGWLQAVGPLVEQRQGRWISFIFSDPVALPPCPACYVVQLHGRTIYVGQTKNLRRRFHNHGFRILYDPESASFVQVTPWGRCKAGEVTFKRRVVERWGDWLMHEVRLIRRLRPIENRA